jgi:hypothetical protein
MEHAQLLEGLNARFTAEFQSGQADDGAYRELVHLADQAQTFTDPVASKVYLIWAEGETELLEDDGEVKDAIMQPFKAEVTSKQYSRKVTAMLRDLRNPAIQELTAQHVNKLGRGAEQTRARRVYDMLCTGDTQKYGACYDGQALFSENHAGANSLLQPIHDQSNLFAFVISVDAVAEVVRVMTTYRNSAGENYGNKWTPNVQADGSPAPSFKLLHGPTLAKPVAEILQLSRGAAQSVMAGTFESVQLDCLEGPYENYWFIVFPTGRPLAMVDYGSIVIPTVGHDTEPGRLHGKAEWIARTDFGLSYYQWHGIAMSKGTP